MIIVCQPGNCRGSTENWPSPSSASHSRMGERRMPHTRRQRGGIYSGIWTQCLFSPQHAAFYRVTLLNCILREIARPGKKTSPGVLMLWDTRVADLSTTYSY